MGVAQLVERWIVVPVAVGSNPTTHPKQKRFIEVLPIRTSRVDYTAMSAMRICCALERNVISYLA